MTKGWILDTYPVRNKMVSWIKNENSIQRIEDNWTPSIYVACDDIRKLELLAANKKISEYVKNISFVEKFEKVTDLAKSQVLQIELADSSHIIKLAKTIDIIEKFGTFRLYNVDVPSAQLYFYEKDIFPFGQFYFSENKWTANDSVESTNYTVPNIKKVEVKVNPKKQSKLPKFTDKIYSITLDKTQIESENEADLILKFVKEIQCIDPDFILTERGDSFDLPYLIHRAVQNEIQERLVLGRDKTPLLRPKREGTSYFSYGRMYYKPSAIKLQGRIHIDKSSCFIWTNDFDIHGIYEIARICRLPLQTAARASIGKCMSSLQFYKATRCGLLIPWRPTMAEAFKTRKELLIGDRGGLVFEPEGGIFENVVELDFISLYGRIMEKKNISAETVLCSCCPDSQFRVPELGYNICKRPGIVKQSIGILLEKRKMYDDLLKKPQTNEDYKIYDARKSALKWILVTSFGYLGFNNAKFGRIDAHMAVCAFARQILLQAVRIAEKHGFQVLHGIVDSLWLYKNGAKREEMLKLKAEIERKTDFEMSLDEYKWIVFLYSKKDESLPVANRYFGAFKDDRLKIRGIELRRHDTPWFFKRCQMEILRLLARGNNIKEVRQLLPEAKKIYKKYLNLLYQNKVPLEELAFAISASKDAEEYKVNTVQTDAIWQLKEEGEYIKAGQRLQYIISDYSRKRKRSTPLVMVNGRYDAKKYAEMLAECYASIVRPFDP